MNEPVRTLAFFCRGCGQPVIVNRTVFSLCASRTFIACPCGKSGLEVIPEDRDFQVSVPCVTCKTDHRVSVPREAFLRQKAISLSCGASGLDCCYIGEEQPVYAAMKRLEEAMDAVEERKNKKEQEEGSPFLNELIMTEVLAELKEIASRGGISCECGGKRFSVKVHYSAVELSCPVCGGCLRIPAATQDDLTDICCKEQLVMKRGH